MSKTLEIERKFLIYMPSLDDLKGARKFDIAQTYLTDGTRIRRLEENGSVMYIKTFKSKISEITRVEIENEISEEEYISSLALADTERKTVYKTRYALPFKEHILEVDIFPFWADRAFLEVELKSENQFFSLPSFLKIIKEVTEDSRYTNRALAKEIPHDKI